MDDKEATNNARHAPCYTYHTECSPPLDPFKRSTSFLCWWPQRLTQYQKVLHLEGYLTEACTDRCVWHLPAVKKCVNWVAPAVQWLTNPMQKGDFSVQHRARKSTLLFCLSSALQPQQVRSNKDNNFWSLSIFNDVYLDWAKPIIIMILNSPKQNWTFMNCFF